MQALEFRRQVLRYLVTRSVHRHAPGLWSARLAPLHRVERPLPVAERAGWVRLGVRLSGICGSDLKLVTGDDSLYLEPEATYPFVPGHELVGELLDAATPVTPGAATIEPGERVAVWSVLGCRARGLDLCRWCHDGWDGLCERRDTGWPDRGIAIGFNRQTGGGWSERCLAHVSQVWRLPASVSDEDAVLLDPAATALAALLRPAAPAAERTLVIGGGPIGLLAAHIGTALRLPGEYQLLARYEFQKRWATEHGVSAACVRSEAAFASWADAQGMVARRVISYGTVYQGVFDRVIDAAGTATSLAWALAAVRPGGTVVLVSCGGNLRHLDPTPIWYREVTLRGIFTYGPVMWDGERVHPYDVLIPRIADGSLRFRDLVTHRFPLDAYPSAFRATHGRQASEAIKVVFQP